MDVDLLFALALLVFYLATQIFGRKKQVPQAPPADEPDSVSYQQEHSAEVDDALREIREALGWPSQQQPTTPPPAAPPASQQMERPSDRRTRLEESRTTQPSRTREQAVFAGDIGGMNEWEAAQKRATQRRADVRAQYGAQGGIPEVKAASRRRSVHPIAQKLRTTDGARQAVVYSEIFRPRWENDLE